MRKLFLKILIKLKKKKLNIHKLNVIKMIYFIFKQNKYKIFMKILF
jgi:hypothetical protein